MFYWPIEEGVPVRPGWEIRRRPWKHIGFASRRGGGRLHAACDLVCPDGTDVRAICGGELLHYRGFYDDTWQVQVLHRCEGMEFIARYGEVRGLHRRGIRPPNNITAGSVIAQVGTLRKPDGTTHGSMLHLELYATIARSPSLSIGAPYASRPGATPGSRRTRDPSTYTAAEKVSIRGRGWHWRFQRRLDLADPTDFLLDLRDGREPIQPRPLIPVGGHCCAYCGGVAVVPTETEAEISERQTRFWAEGMVRRSGLRLGASARAPIGLDEDEEIDLRPERTAISYLFPMDR